MGGEIINWFHVLAVSPLFLYIGAWYATQPVWIYWILAGMGAIVIVYHYSNIMRDLPNSSWVSLFHAFIVGPILLFLGIMGKNAPEFLYPLMTILGWGALGYHGTKLVKLYT